MNCCRTRLRGFKPTPTISSSLRDFVSDFRPAENAEIRQVNERSNGSRVGHFSPSTPLKAMALNDQAFFLSRCNRQPSRVSRCRHAHIVAHSQSEVSPRRRGGRGVRGEILGISYPFYSRANPRLKLYRFNVSSSQQMTLFQTSLT